MFGHVPNTTGSIYGFRPVVGGKNQGVGILQGESPLYPGCLIGSEEGNWGGFSIDLSRGSSVYSSSSMQPKALQTLPCIKI